MPERISVGSDWTVTCPTFTGTDEEAVVPDTDPSITVTSRVTGLELTAPAVSPIVGGTEEAPTTDGYTAAFTAADHTVDLDILDVTWTADIDGATRVVTQVVEVVGGFYESIPGLRAISSLASATTRPLAQLRKFRTEIEDICETARGTAYVERCAVEQFDVGPSGSVRLGHRHPSRILAVTVDGVAKTVGDYEVDLISRRFGPVSGRLPVNARVVVAYVHGYSSPPVALVEACREYVRAKCSIDSSSANRGVSSVTNLATQEVYRFTTADPKYGRWTGIEGVDERINTVDDERVLIG